MMEELVRPVRSAAAWVMLIFVTLLELLAVVQLVGHMGDVGIIRAAMMAEFGSLYALALPILAVVLTAFARPSTGDASTVAVVAFVQYGIALLISVLIFGGYLANYLGLTPVEASVDMYYQQQLLPPAQEARMLIYSAGHVALLAVAATAVWRILTGLNTIGDDELLDSDDYLDDSDDDELSEEDSPTPHTGGSPA